MATSGLAPGYRNVVTALRLFRAAVPTRDQAPAQRAKTSAWITRWKLPESAGAVTQEDIPGGRIFRAAGESAGHVFYLHGGGLVFYSLEDFGSLMAHFAARSRCTVTAFEYLKAPEHSVQEIVETLAAGIEQRLREIPAHEPLVLAGDSIGGYLALYLALRRFPKRFARLVLIYPVLDLHVQRPSYTAYGRGYCLNADMMGWFQSLWQSYDRGFHEFSPFHLNDADRENLPETVVVSAEMDVLRDEAFDWCSYLQAGKFPVKHHPMASLAHDFCLYAGAIPEARAAVDFVTSQLSLNQILTEQCS
ncbi:MAG: alpha/beta hydrolase [Acidobacteriia bacterium]|nr:alpha/beta hydrolase [Terriglobia bacterium]